MKTEVIKLDPAEPDVSKMKKAAGVLAAGGLVAFPTETVYGLGCRVARNSLEKLSELKGREAGKYYTLHIGDKSQLQRYVPQPSMREKKLVQNAWPGPLTIVFSLSDTDVSELRKNLSKAILENLYKDNSLGVRLPDHAVAAALLKETTVPVVAPSANYSGDKPPVTAEQVLKSFDGKIEIILDAGPTSCKQSSTVVKIGKQGLEVLRPGFYSKAQLTEMAIVRLLFVCTGNTCRSPMAKGIFKKELAEKLGCKVDQLEQMGYKIGSAGAMGVTGWPASAEAVTICSRNGIDIASHSSSALTSELIDASDLIFVMSDSHRKQVLQLSPGSAEKCLLLAGDEEVPDPIGQNEKIYEDCFVMIENAITKRISELKL